MPMMIAMVAVLGGGGYFAMGRGKTEEKKIPDPKPGPVMELGEKEMFVNLLGGEFFLRVKINVQMDKYAEVGHGGGGDGHGGKGGPDPTQLMLRQIAFERIRTLTLEDIEKPGNLKRLRMLLAQDFNNALEAAHEAEEEKTSKKKKKDDEEEHKHSFAPPMPGDINKVDPNDLENPSLDSDEGPVMVVTFGEFASIRE